MSVFDPVELGGLTLPSALIRSATAERISVESVEEGERLAAMYQALIEGGAGLVITGHIAVDASGKVMDAMPQIRSESQRAGWKRVVERAHQAGGLICGQINHGGGRCYAMEPSLLKGRLAGPVCVSSLPDLPRDPLDGAVLTDGQIEQIIEAYAETALAVKEVGMDAVQIHGAHGYLGNQFLSPWSNRRTDRWGETLENRARFLREVVRACRESVGADFPLGMKLAAIEDEDKKGWTPDEAIPAAQWFVSDGLDFIEISGGFDRNLADVRVRPDKGEAWYLPLARRFKEALNIPVIAVGGFRSLAVMNEALDSGACDAVSASRPFICEPDFPNRLRRGENSACGCRNLCLMTPDGVTRCVFKERKNK